MKKGGKGLKEFMSIKPAQQRMLERILWTEEKEAQSVKRL